MALKVYNTMTGQKEDFIPINPPQVKMYVCGITPYDETHLGHGRAYVTFDTIRRYLKCKGYQVYYVQNITDIDDKIIAKGQGSRVKCQEVVEKYIQAYFDVMDKLNVERADVYPRATEHIPEMISWIKALIDNGAAYVVDHDVYYLVDAFNDYGKLSKRNKDDLLSGARVAVDQRKKSPLDFALWKSAKEGEPSWDSPWGQGRPGWHIECTVMSTKYLGDQFDIHGGGMDLIFPHHENEIAQTEGKTHKLWVKYWLHNGFVNINKQKMSKSLGNFFALSDIFKTYDPMVVRMFLLQTHYRSPINYSDQELNSAKETYSKLVKFIADIDFLLTKTKHHSPKIELKDMREDLQKYKDQFSSSMDDDFNTAAAIAAIFELIHFCNKTISSGDSEKECLKAMKEMVVELCGMLGINLEHRTQSTEHRTQIDEKIRERETAKKNKDFARADKIREELAEQGIILEDTVHGTRWKQAS